MLGVRHVEVGEKLLNPEDLYELDADLPEMTGPVLLHSLDGFVDAGSTGQLVREHLLESLEHRVIARFDVDSLIDYRARRPPMTFDRDHWASYDAPELVVRLLRDEAGSPFLMLSGPELITKNSWFDKVQVPGSAAGLLELRLGEAGHDAVGFAVHVPHYLAQSAYPAAAVAALEAIISATGLVLPVDRLRDAAAATDADIAEQVDGNDEVEKVVRALEQQYDAFAGAAERDSLLAESQDMPTAEELGAQFERFLAEQDGPDSSG